MRPFLRTITFAALLGCTITTSAQWSTNPNVNNVICSTVNQQRGPRVASDGSGGAIITWMDDRNNATNSTDIYAQRINASGVVQWTANGVAICADPGLQSSPQITTDGSGGAIIVWQDNRVFNIPEIFAQRVNANGVIQWAVNGVSLGGDSIGQSQAQLISDGLGGAIVTWKSGTTQFSNIRAQRINTSGAIQWAVAGANMSTSLTPEGPQIISVGAGGAIISWNEWVGVYPAGSHDIYAQRINSAGTTQWGARGTAICSAPFNQTGSQLTSDGSNGAIIIWPDSRTGMPPINLYAQRVNSTGAVQWAADGINITPVALNVSDHKILSDGNGGAYTTWRYSNNTIYAQRLNNAGAIQWAPIGVSIGSGGNPSGPQIATDGGTGVIISFYKTGGPNGTDVYAQKINPAGTIQWPTNGVIISSARLDQQAQQMVADSSGGAIMAWMDNRDDATYSIDIYAQRVGANGTLGGPTRVNENDHSLPATFSLMQNYPNPFNPSTHIKFSIGIPSGQISGQANFRASLKVFDVLGREVATLVNEDLKAGSYETTFDAASLSSGVYFYRLETADFSKTMKMTLMR